MKNWSRLIPGGYEWARATRTSDHRRTTRHEALMPAARRGSVRGLNGAAMHSPDL